MGFIANVVANTPILSSWGNLVRDRTVMDFANVAERTSQWVSPPEGAMSYLRDVDRIEYFDGTAWQRAGAGRIVAYAKLSANQSLTGSPFDINALDVTWTAISGHDYRTEVHGMLTNLQAAPNNAFFGIGTAANRAANLREIALALNTSQAGGFYASLRETGLTGSQTRTLRYNGGTTNNFQMAGTGGQYFEMFVSEV